MEKAGIDRSPCSCLHGRSPGANSRLFGIALGDTTLVRGEDPDVAALDRLNQVFDPLPEVLDFVLGQTELQDGAIDSNTLVSFSGGSDGAGVHSAL